MGRAHFAPAALIAALTFAPAAVALQPLGAFVEHARATNPDARVARATAEQRDAEASVAGGRLLPSFLASGTYTRNQYEVTFALPSALGGTGAPITIQPSNQLDASLVLSVPIVDVGAWERRSAAKTTQAAATKDAAAAEIDLDRRVTRSYYQLVASEAVARSADRALLVAKGHLGLTRDKKAAGTASELDVQRAEADVARADQDVAAATFAVATAQRDLATLSGIDPEPSTSFPDDDLHEEEPLTIWLSNTESLPSIASAHANRQAREETVHAAQAAWFPTVSASATERFTNAPSFVGHNAYFFVQATAAWKLDPTIPAAVRVEEAAAAVSRAREDKAQRSAEDAIFQAWHQVRADIDTARAARAQVRATALAADLAGDRYQSGVATQLDLLQAEQDAFRADVTRIQADADLAYARASLRIASGRRTGRAP